MRDTGTDMYLRLPFSVRTQLFTVIPYACATVALVVVNVLSDRLKNSKGIFLMLCLSVSCLGFILLMAVESVPVKIFATCLVTSGLYPAVILIAVWLGINTAG